MDVQLQKGAFCSNFLRSSCKLKSANKTIQHVPNIHSVVPYQKRAFSRREAAYYLGISPSFFDDLVKNGEMPKPIHLGRRTLWDVRQLDEAFDKELDEVFDNLSDPDPNPWDRLVRDRGGN